MKYALITGASSGIGYELAIQFAKQNHNIILVARREEKLKELSAQLKERYNIKSLIIPIDLSENYAPEEILRKINQKNISVEYLINNAGFVVFGHFAETNWEQEFSMLNLQVINLTKLIKLILPQMLMRKSGKILNIGSTGSFIPGPYCAAYCAAKSYILSLSEALAAEVKGTGVTVSVLCPGGTKTEFGGNVNKKDSKNFLLRNMDAEKVAKIAYKTMMKGERLVVPGFLNKSQIFMARLLPRNLVVDIAEKAMSEYRDFSTEKS